VLHVVSIGGHDEMQIVRIIVAQMISLIITLVINKNIFGVTKKQHLEM